MKKNYILAICLLISSTVLAGPGIKLVTLSQTASSGQKSESTIYINDSQMVIETKQNGNYTIMYDAAKEEVVIVDHGRREFSKMGQKELVELGNQINSMKGLIKAFYKNMPPETQKKFAPLVNGKDPNISFTPKGSATVKNWKTTEYQVADGQNNKLFDMNIADFSAVGVKKEDVAAVRKLSIMLDKYLSGVESFVPGANIFSNLNSEKNPMFIKGIPVKTVAYEENGAIGDQFWVTNAEKSDFSLADFKIPSEYKPTVIKFDNPMQN